MPVDQPPSDSSGEDREPIRCGATINGPKVGRHVVAWRKRCRNRVKHEGDRCRWHGGPAT